MQTKNKKRRGGTSILAVFFVTLFAVLAVSFTAMSNVNVQMSQNHHHMSVAQSAAESGLQYGGYLIDGYIAQENFSTANNTVSDSEAQQAFDNLLTYIQNSLNGSLAIGGGSVGAAVNITGGRKIVIPDINIATNESTIFSIEIIVSVDSLT